MHALPEQLLPKPASEPRGPAVRAEGLLRRLDELMLRVDGLVSRVLPDELNPLARTGAVATTTLVVATVSGILLLIWYRASVFEAHASVEAMTQAPWTAGFVRSLHRHSSDACLFFALLHGFKLLLARRFAGARWLAWTTGVLLVVLLWLEGWLGYWLVWDEAGGRVAAGTAKMLDAVPIFAEPPSRSFLADERLSSLFFFVVFFVHVLLPLALAVAAWLHVARVRRPKLVTGRALSLWVVGALCAVSLLLPAGLGGEASMTAPLPDFRIDAWYLAPLWLTERLGAGALWSIALLGPALAASLPWLLGRRRPPVAEVTESLCNACTKCFEDCPYEAITMAPRTDGRSFDARARVLPERCVGCGICAGSCDTAGIGLPDLRVQAERRRIEAWIDERVAEGAAPRLAFTCAQSAGAVLQPVDSQGRSPALPSWLVVELPCAGWLQPLTVERALKHGAQVVAVVSCRPGSCTHREGATWTRERLAGRREPALRRDRIETDRLQVIALDRPEGGELLEHLAAPEAGGERRRRLPRVLAAAAVLAVLAAAGPALTWLPFSPPRPEGAELVVSFKHPGQVTENCRDRTPEELAALPPHMRQPRVCDRRREPVRLEVRIDGRTAASGRHEPGGLWGDGPSVAILRLPVEPGPHRVELVLDDGPEGEPRRSSRLVDFPEAARRVVLFDRSRGFTWHGGEKP